MPLTTGPLAQIPEATVANPYTALGRLSRSSGSMGQVQRVQYNGYVFPMALTSSAQVEPQYSNTGRHRIGTILTIEVECILIDQTATAVDRSNPAFQIPTTDLNLFALRSALNQNGKLLSFELQGLGLINVSGDPNHYAPGITSTGTVIDIDKGPKTKVIEWTPITSTAARVKWQVSVTLSDCSSLSNSIPFYKDFYGTIQTQVDHLGYCTRTISGALQVPTPIIVTGVSTATEADAAQNVLEKQFPRLTHFDREYDTTLSADGGTLEFTITDTELRTDTPYFPGTSRPDVSITASSGLGEGQGGFGMWTVNMDGTIPVMHGVSKLYGFLAALTLIDYYLNKGFLGTIPGGTEATNYDGTEKSYVILRELTFTDEIYDREISFSASWQLATSLDTLIQATGMFVPAELEFDEIVYNDTNEEGVTPEENAPVTFSRWRASAARQVKRRNYHNFIYTGTDLPQIVLCSEQAIAQKPSPTESNETPPGSDNFETPKPAYPPPNKSWMHVDYEVSLLETNQVFSAGIITDEPVTQLTESAGSADTLRMLQDPDDYLGTNKFLPFGPDLETAGTSSILSQYLRKLGKNKYFVEVRGVLVRAYHRPAVPYVGAIGGIPAFKVGRGVCKEIILGRGTTSTNLSKPFAIRAVAFRQVYAMLDVPKIFTLQDSAGNPIFNSQVDA